MIYSWISIQVITNQTPDVPHDIYENKKTEQLPSNYTVPQSQTLKKNSQEHKNIKIENEKIKNLFNIVSVKSHNYYTTYGTYVSHKDYRIVVPTKTSNAQIKQVAETITSSEAKDINSVRIWFFWPDSDPTGAYSAGMSTCTFYNNKWIIKMEYGKTYSEATPQYSNNTDILSLAKRKKIFWDLVLVEDRAGIAGNTEQCKQVIAKRYGITVSEVSKIQVEAVNKMWPMPEDPGY